MNSSSAWASVVLVAASALLLHAAWTDLRYYKIRNDFVIAFALLFVLYVALLGQWHVLLWHAAFAGLMLVVMLMIYTQGWMGGGDVKILAATFLWTGAACALPFALLLSLFATAHGFAAKRGWAGSQQRGRDQRIPFAPSVAAALIVTFLLGCLEPAENWRPLLQALTSFWRKHLL